MADTQKGNPFGWLQGEDAREAFTDQQAMQAEARRFFLEQAQLFFDVFRVGRGPELLEHLRTRTIEMPLMVVNGVVGSAPEIGLGPAEWAYYREGQNSVIRYIETMIEAVLRSDNEEQGNDG